jgi:hypothetical protein
MPRQPATRRFAISSRHSLSWFRQATIMDVSAERLIIAPFSAGCKAFPAFVAGSALGSTDHQ